MSPDLFPLPPCPLCRSESVVRTRWRTRDSPPLEHCRRCHALLAAASADDCTPRVPCCQMAQAVISPFSPPCGQPATIRVHFRDQEYLYLCSEHEHLVLDLSCVERGSPTTRS